MKIISAREFRASQRKFLTLVNNGEDLILKARGLGSFRIIPVSSKDKITNTPELQARIAKAREEIKSGYGITVHGKEELNAYLESL